MPTLLEMIKEAVVSLNRSCRNSEIKNYILGRWPDQNPDSINDQINSASVNLPSRINYPENQRIVSTPREKYDFLYRTARGLVEIYNPEKHGNWGIFQFNGKFRIFRGDMPPDVSDYEKNYGVLYHTDLRWLRFLKTSGLRVINFWSNRTDMLTALYEGMPFFFKTEDQKIEGFGNFVRWERMSPADAWSQFGRGNGAQDMETFFSMLSENRRRDSGGDDDLITCFVLRNPVFFASPPSLSDCGISAFQTVRYIDSIEGAIITGEIGEFAPVDLHLPSEASGPVHSPSTVDTRPYQTALKEYLRRTYKERCAICGLDIPELLRASHIIPHSADDNTARRLDNSILLCSLHDSLLDRGLITLSLETGEYHIKLSSAIMKSNNPAVVRIREDLSHAAFRPPVEHPPSEDSLSYHNRYVFVDGKGHPRK